MAFVRRTEACTSRLATPHVSKILREKTALYALPIFLDRREAMKKVNPSREPQQSGSPWEALDGIHHCHHKEAKKCQGTNTGKKQSCHKNSPSSSSSPITLLAPLSFAMNLARAATEAALSDAKHKRYGVASSGTMRQIPSNTPQRQKLHVKGPQADHFALFTSSQVR